MEAVVAVVAVAETSERAIIGSFQSSQLLKPKGYGSELSHWVLLQTLRLFRPFLIKGSFRALEGLRAIPEIPKFLKFQELPAKPKKGKP